MNRNFIFNTNPPAIVRQIGETQKAYWQAVKQPEREIVMDFFKRSIAILDKTHKEVMDKYPRMFKR